MPSPLPAAPRLGAGQPALVAVCVCTADRLPLLRRLLHGLERLAPPPDGHRAELIVVDNRPGSGAAALVAEARSRLPLPVVLHEEAAPGIAAARNRAVRAALERRAAAVAFIDDDDLPDPGWLAALVAAWRRTGADMVFGGYLPASEMAVPRWLARSSLVQPKPFAHLNHLGVPAGAATCNALLSARLLASLSSGGDGPFRHEFSLAGGEDTDLFVRAARRGFAHALCPEAEVRLMWEPERLTWRGVTRRSFRFGTTRWHLALAHGDPGPRATELRRVGAALVRHAVRAAGFGVRGRRGRFARHYLKCVELLGETHALLGGSFAYYGRPEGVSRPSPPGQPGRPRPPEAPAPR